MTNLHQLTTSQLGEIIAIREKIEALQNQMDSIVGGGKVEVEVPNKRRRSAAVRAKMAAAQRARRAKIIGTGATNSKPAKKIRIDAVVRRRGPNLQRLPGPDGERRRRRGRRGCN